jgi:hypothetical protein
VLAGAQQEERSMSKFLLPLTAAFALLVAIPVEGQNQRGSRITIASAQANGTTSAVKNQDPDHRAISQFRTIFISGTFDGASVLIEGTPQEGTPDGSTNWYSITGLTAVTAETISNIEVRVKWYRAVVSGGGGSTSINIFID